MKKKLKGNFILSERKKDKKKRSGGGKWLKFKDWIFFIISYRVNKKLLCAISLFDRRIHLLILLQQDKGNEWIWVSRKTMPPPPPFLHPIPFWFSTVPFPSPPRSRLIEISHRQFFLKSRKRKMRKIRICLSWINFWPRVLFCSARGKVTGGKERKRKGI